MNSKWGFVVASIIIPVVAIVVGFTNKEIRCFFRLDSEEACQSNYIDVDLIVQTYQFAPLKDVEVRFITKGAPEVRSTDTNGYSRLRIPSRGDAEIILSKNGFETLRQIINLGNDPNRTRTYQLKQLPSRPTRPPNPSIQPVSYKLLKYFLANKEFIKADEETSRILLQITGNESNSHNDPVSASKIDCSVYQAIDRLWTQYSKAPSGESKFGFSVQRRIWVIVGSYVKFGEQVGWGRNNDWITYDDLNNDTARNLGEVPAGYLPSKFRGPIANSKLSGGWMVWSLLPNNSAGKCLSN